MRKKRSSSTDLLFAYSKDNECKVKGRIGLAGKHSENSAKPLLSVLKYIFVLFVLLPLYIFYIWLLMKSLVQLFLHF